MKKIISLISLGLIGIGMAYAEAEKVECSSNPGFKTNTCDACYTETYKASETADGWVSTLTDVTIPWDHAGDELDEIIYDKEQKKPSIKTTLKVTTTPEKIEDLWENHETLIWKPYEDHKEFVIKKGESVGLYRIKEPGGITIQGNKPDDTIMFVTPLSVGSFNSQTNVETEPKTRNICIMGSFTVEKKVAPAVPTTPVETPVQKPETTPVTTPAVETPAPVTTEEALETVKQEEEIKEELNAAGPEPVVAATTDQTKTEAGAWVWILIILALALGSAYHAWRKQKG